MEKQVQGQCNDWYCQQAGTGNNEQAAAGYPVFPVRPCHDNANLPGRNDNDPIGVKGNNRCW